MKNALNHGLSTILHLETAHSYPAMLMKALKMPYK